MSVLHNKKIIVAVSGGIAAYKTAFLVRLLIKKGAEVKVLMTPEAQKFVAPLTLSTLSKNPVGIELSDELGNWTNHVELGLWADFMIIAPATANTLSKIANGESNNLVLTTYLSAKCPVIIAPAMDLDMYKHPTTKQNLDTISQFPNHSIIYPNEGELASGLEGKGRMAEPEEILLFLEFNIKEKLKLSGKKILITAGPTYEPIDPVRFIGNHSSGKMGFEIAKEAAKQGAEVILISGPSNQKLNREDITLIKVTTAQQMFDEVFKHYETIDIAIMSAAVADYKPKKVSEIKIKKETTENFTIELERNPDILKTMGKQKKSQFLVGFALETNNEVENAKGKLKRKNLDMIVLNSLQDKGAGFKGNTNKITLIDKDYSTQEFPLKSKTDVALDIIEFITKKMK